MESTEAKSGSSEPFHQQHRGKEVAKVPHFDGKITVREYRDLVAVYQLNTDTPLERQAGRLVEEFGGDARKAIKSLPDGLMSLRHPDGVERLLVHLERELEPRSTISSRA